MRIAGIIAEYNPFHNGHAWHIAETRRLTGCDAVVVCMDGHFTQRGECALWSKWNRARMALACGADAVFELPALFAVRSADAFARGGVTTLGALGVDALSFGSELNDPEKLWKLVGIAENEPTSVSLSVQKKLSEGKAQPRARGEAVAEYLGLPAEAVNRPNLMLAVEYLRVIKRFFPGMSFCAVRRVGDYHDPALGGMASAAAIRAALARGEEAAAMAAIPDAARPWAVPETLHPMDDLLLFRLRGLSEAALGALPDIAEGLERRLYRLCREAASRDALLTSLKCKRYTHARLSRMLTHALLGMDQALIDAHPMPTYARLIGMRGDAAPVLRALKARASLPIVSSAKVIEDDPIFRLECRATDTWALLHDDPALRRSGREYTERFVVV